MPTGSPSVYRVGRYYDPTTAQFLSVDPLVGITGAPYSFAGDNPLGGTDPTGLDCTNTDSCPKGTTYTDYGGSWNDPNVQSPDSSTDQAISTVLAGGSQAQADVAASSSARPRSQESLLAPGEPHCPEWLKTTVNWFGYAGVPKAVADLFGLNVGGSWRNAGSNILNAELSLGLGMLAKEGAISEAAAAAGAKVLGNEVAIPATAVQLACGSVANPLGGPPAGFVFYGSQGEIMPLPGSTAPGYPEWS